MGNCKFFYCAPSKGRIVGPCPSGVCIQGGRNKQAACLQGPAEKWIMTCVPVGGSWPSYVHEALLTAQSRAPDHIVKNY